MLRVRPASAARPAVVLLAFSAALAVIGRTSGAGWMSVMVALTLGVMAVGLGWPALALRRLHVTVRAPRDGTVGRPAIFTVSVDGPTQRVKLRLHRPEGGWVAAEPPAEGVLMATPTRRGVIDRVEVDVRCGAPLGLMWWRRRERVALTAPLEVGPRPVSEDELPVPRGGVDGGEGRAGGRGDADSVRSVRDYTSGDPVRLVHWPATARHGSLLVKELEDPERPQLAIVVDLRGRDDAAEAVASRAAGLADDALAAGIPVVLLTAEASGPTAGRVASPVEVGRRLARAVAGPPPEGPLPAGATVVRLAAPAAAATTRRRGRA